MSALRARKPSGESGWKFAAFVIRCRSFMTSIEERLAPGWIAQPSPGGTEVGHPTGIRCDPAFVTVGDERMFLTIHHPVATPSVAMVICPPIYAEAIRSQRQELVLGWELSAAGVGAIRVHYRGSGHSDGNPATLTFGRLVDDARRAAQIVREELGAQTIGFAGTRLGALVAAAAAHDHPGAPLVLWEPLLDMDGYFTELRRARMIGRLKHGTSGGSGRGDMEVFAEQGLLDVMGNPVAYSLYESVIQLDPVRLVADGGARCFLEER